MIGAIASGSSGPGIYEQAQLYMDFTADKFGNGGRLNGVWQPISSLITTTRASLAQMDDSAGNWAQFGNNTGRQSDKGLLVEEARTNSIRNNTMVGAVPGINGSGGFLPTNWAGGQAGLNYTIIGTGNELGVDYIDIRFSGTTNTTFFSLTFEPAANLIVATNADTWSASVFTKLLSGSGSLAGLGGQLYIDELTAAGVFIKNWGSPNIPWSVGGPLFRTSFTHALTDPTVGRTRSFLLWTCANGQAVDFTMRVGWPQLELGAFVTSPIRTSTVAVTRAADVIFGPSMGAPTVVSLFVDSVGGILGSVILLQLDDGTPTNRIFLWRNLAFAAGNVRNTADTVALSEAGAMVDGVPAKLAMAVQANDAAFSAIGRTTQLDTTVTFPPGVTRIALGNNGSSTAQPNGYLRRAAYWNTRLSDAQLQAITN